MKSINASSGPTHLVDRATIFKSVLTIYEQESVYPMFIKFVGEIGVNEGGLQRDMFTAFYEEAYAHLFEGATTVIPMVRCQMDMATYALLGRIISHGYLVTGILPDRIALPSLLVALLGPSVKISTSTLLDAFLDYISATERTVLKKALDNCNATYKPEELDQIIAILSRFGCRMVPTPSLLISIIEQAAKYEFCLKPAAALAIIHSGIPLCHKSYWNKKSPEDIVSCHFKLIATPAKVIAMFDPLNVLSPAEERIYGYLISMIGNMQVPELKLFLRFITGCSVCIGSAITVTFNSLSGLARRPIAHTCDFTLELPVTYVNYDDFYGEFKCILDSTKEEFSWQFDAL